MSRTRIPVVNPVVVLREESDDWAILFDPDTAKALGINPVGVAVWRALDGSRSLEQVVATIREAFDEVPDSAADELERFIADLEAQGFVRFTGDAEPR